MKINCFLIINLFFMINFIITVVQSFNLTLIHNNDLHSHFAPVNEWSSPCDEKTLKQGKCFGGVARIVSKVKEIREKHKSSLFLNAGDSFQGTVWYSLYKWKIVSHFTNLLKYDAMAIGNHEFDDGVDGYVPFVDETLPVIPSVCCNIDVSDEPKLLGKIKKSIVVEVDNQKIGIIGYLTPETSFLSSPGNTIKFTDEIQCIKEEIKQMQSQGINIFIGLGHSGFVKDVEIAQKVPELDVIVGGHSHTFLFSGPKPSIEEVVDTYPTIVDHGSHKTLVLQAYAFGKYLGLIDIEFDANGNVHRFEGQPILLDNTVPEDPLIAEEVKNYDIKVKEKYGETIGKTYVFLEGSQTCGIRECNLGNLLCDASIEYYLKKRPITGDGWTDVAVCLTNGGGVRSNINAFNKDGNITLEDLIGVFPFSNNMLTLVMSGQLIRQTLEFSVSDHDIHMMIPNNKFLQMSGIRVEYNLTNPVNQRVNEVLIRCANCLVPNFRPLNDTQIYKVVVPKYIADGGDGYHFLKNVPRIQSEALDLQIVSEYISEKPYIYPENDGRISFVH